MCVCVCACVCGCVRALGAHHHLTVNRPRRRHVGYGCSSSTTAVDQNSSRIDLYSNGPEPFRLNTIRVRIIFINTTSEYKLGTFEAR